LATVSAIAGQDAQSRDREGAEPARVTLQPPTETPVPCSASADVSCLRQLVRMSRCDLLSLYDHAQPGPIPCGFTPGRPIHCGGGFRCAPFTCLSRLTIWRGKVFGPDCTAHNRLLGINTVPAYVCYGESWYDGRPAIILDYEGCSRIASKLRDEIREVAPCLYVGLTFVRRGCEPQLALFFALDAHGCFAPSAVMPNAVTPPMAPAALPEAPRTVMFAEDAVVPDPQKKEPRLRALFGESVQPLGNIFGRRPHQPPQDTPILKEDERRP
jgi:hypothetical protein